MIPARSGEHGYVRAPNIISGGDQTIEPGGRVGAVVGASGQAGVKDADIETAPHRCGISRNQIFLDGAIRKTSTMHGHAELAQYAGLLG